MKLSTVRKLDNDFIDIYLMFLEMFHDETFLMLKHLQPDCNVYPLDIKLDLLAK